MRGMEHLAIHSAWKALNLDTVALILERQGQHDFI